MTNSTSEAEARKRENVAETIDHYNEIWYEVGPASITYKCSHGVAYAGPLMCGQLVILAAKQAEEEYSVALSAKDEELRQARAEVERLSGLVEEPTPGGDGCYCAHHPDDPAHTRTCYVPPSQLVVWDKAIAIAKDKTWWGDKANPEYIGGVVTALERARDEALQK